MRGDGSLLTPPQVFYQAQTAPDGSTNVDTSNNGQGNVQLTLQQPPAQVDTVLSAPGWAGAAPGGPTALSFAVGNSGGTAATNVVLTAVLDGALSFQSATPAPSSMQPMAAAADGSTPTATRVTWNLPNLAYQGGGRVVLLVRVPEGEIGDAYPVTATLGAAGVANKEATVTVALAHQNFLPVVNRQ